jgi:diacylglycerol O-acyltransferase
LKNLEQLPLATFLVDLLREFVMAKRKRMSSVDTAWLRMDSPHNLMMISGVMIFDRRLSLARLKQTIERRFLKFERFRERPEQDLSGAYWEPDPDFDIDHHVCRAKLGAKAGKAELQALVSKLAATPLDPAHPLWQFQLVENFAKASALIVRIHHCYADGIALIAVMQSLTGAGVDEGDLEEPQAPVEASEPDEELAFLDQLIVPAAQRLSKAVKVGGDVLANYLAMLSKPGKAAELAAQGYEFVKEAAALAAMADDSPTRFKGVPGITKVVAWTEPLPLPEVKAVGRVLGCSVNDVLLSCVAGALRDYLEQNGDATHGIELRAMVPVNLRPLEQAGKLGNHFGLVALELPVGLANPLARLYETRRRMGELKGSYQAILSLGLLAAVGMAPKMLQEKVLGLMASKGTAVMTNVPGPQEKLYLAGARIEQQMFWVPQSGNIGMGVSILSYGGSVQFGLITAQNLVPDPEAIIGCFAEEFEKLLLLTLMEPWDSPREPEEVEESFHCLLALNAVRNPWRS